MLNSVQLQDAEKKERSGAGPVADTCARASAAQQNVLKRKASRAINSAAVFNRRRTTGRADGACAPDARKHTRNDSLEPFQIDAGIPDESRLCDEQPVKRRVFSSGVEVADAPLGAEKEGAESHNLGASSAAEAMAVHHNMESRAGDEALDAMLSTDDMVTNVQDAGLEDFTRLSPAPLVSFTRAALDDSQGAGELAPPVLPQHEKFGIDDILHMPMNTEFNNDSFWGDLEYPVLSQDTQYLQLHESRAQSPGQREQPSPASSSGVTQTTPQEGSPALNYMLWPNFGAPKTPTLKATQSHQEYFSTPLRDSFANTANVKQNTKAESSAEKNKVQTGSPQRTEQFTGLQWNAHLAPCRSGPDMYSDVLAPEIETRILAAPHPVKLQNPSSGSSAIRIAPRNNSKREQSSPPSCLGREQSRSRPGNRPKRSRQGYSLPVKPAANVRPREHSRRQPMVPETVSSGVSLVQPWPMPFPLGSQYASAVAANPMAAAAATMAAAMAVSRNPGVPHPSAESVPFPHPMAGPLLFAQGLPTVNSDSTHPPCTMPVGNKASVQSNSRAGDTSKTNEEQKQGIAAPLSSVAEASNRNLGESNGSPSAPTPMMFSGFPYNMPPVMGPGVMPMDPNAFVQVAHMWYAALTGAGTSPAGPALSDPAHAAFLSQAAFHSAARTRAGTPITPRGNAACAGGGPSGSVGQPPAPGSEIPASNTTVAKSRPIFITDDGTHVVVEQQAPAKLMKHPVLGRLQLQPKHQVAAGDTSGPMMSFSGQGVGSGPQNGNSRANQRDVSPIALSCLKGGSVPSPQASPSASSPEDRRKRLVWTPELHDRFVQAISAIGINRAVPKTLVQIMNVEGLTTEHVKSHLQKYRNSLRKAAVEDAQDEIVKTGNSGNGSNRLIINSSPDAGERLMPEVRVMPSIAKKSTSIDAKKGRPTASMTRHSTGDVREGNSTRTLGPMAHAELSAVRKDWEMPNALRPPTRGNTGEDARGPSGEGSAVKPTSQGSATNVANTGVTPSASGETESRLQMQERTMHLQFQLQVMVHRAVTLQKQLQLMIEKQNEQRPGPACRRVSSAATESQNAAVSCGSDKEETRNAGVESEQGGEKSGRNVDIDSLVKEQMKMQRELDRQTAIVRHEIGVIQQRLKENAEEVDTTVATAHGKTG